MAPSPKELFLLAIILILQNRREHKSIETLAEVIVTIFRRFAAASGLVFLAMLLGVGTISQRSFQESARLPCNAREIARAGQLTFVAEYDAWVSARGELFELRNCRPQRMMGTGHTGQPRTS